MSEVALQARLRRQKRLKLRLCTVCGKSEPSKGTTCEICRSKKMRYYHKRVSSGVCRCGKALTHGKVCQQCAKKYRNSHYRLVLEILAHYGEVCACCGDTNLVHLTIDHINGGGNTHARIIGRGSSLYRYLKRDNFPSGFQILCLNCNHGRAINDGICPHNGINDIKFRSANHKSRVKCRNEAIYAYGGKCVKCGETMPHFLHLDHVNNDGAEHRKIIGKNQDTWARKNGFPNILQLLCANCNLSKERTGFKEYLARSIGMQRKDHSQ